ncbi:pimeloyl-ACP methyl ester carboxylesterase [Glaciihabitans tibetensis]|uniref:Pimeloyl-ACP methyl ester carboxylesterase n=1 Tax=Glaciihabitans tibetensis TaxID=1266600 RepID=A0A2T0VF63_9MICO|nr:alpha/beta fold hydrolase [Glaciihabitans tibetensis]PRY68835.1 pimeloyl-ACP methyl ester carboxylesterase [Glaciihabitans tibetensis]
MKETSHTTVDAAIPHLDGVEHRYIDLPGLRMHVAEAGSGEPLLLLHGFPEHWWEWRDVMPALASDFRVICPDLRGAGWTDAPPTGYDSDQLFADLLALIDALQLTRVRIIAHDWSALLAFRLGLERPDLVDGILCLATPHPWVRFSPKYIPLLRFLWFQPVVAAPGLGPRLLGRGQQRLARYLLRGFQASPQAFTERDIDIFLTPLRDPAHARAGSALYRKFILPEAARIMSGHYRDRHLTARTRLVYGLADRGLRREMAGGYEGHADDLAVVFEEGAAHFVADDSPEAVVRHAREMFAPK